MNEVIDIYTKLIIAIISFIAPLIIHLLSMFSDALAHIKRRGEVEVEQMDELVKKQVQEEGIQIQELMKKSDSLYKERESKLKTQQNLLDPKRQIKRIFPILFLALIFLALYQLADKQKWLENYNLLLCSLLFFMSFACSVIGVFFLKCIAWSVIDIKEQLAQDKEKTPGIVRVSTIDEKK